MTRTVLGTALRQEVSMTRTALGTLTRILGRFARILPSAGGLVALLIGFYYGLASDFAPGIFWVLVAVNANLYTILTRA